MFTVEKSSLCTVWPNDLWPVLNRFCEYLNGSSANTYIIMAHKAARFFQLLIDEGLLDKRLQDCFISNIALDYEYELKDEKIVIIDDIMISGTAVSSTVSKLIKRGVSKNNIEIIVMIRDIEYRGINFLKNNESDMIKCDYIASNSECIRISYEISHVFAYSGICCDVEFPTYKERIINTIEHDCLLSSLYWDIFNISNLTHEKGKISVVSLFPKCWIQQKVWDFVGADLSDFLQLKLRVYLHDYTSGVRSINVIPLALLAETTESEVDSIIALLYNQIGISKEVFEDLDYRAKVRFIQFYIANAIVLVCNTIHGWPQLEVSENWVRVLFGNIIYPQIYNSMKNLNEKKIKIKIDKKRIKPNLLGYEDRFDALDILRQNDDHGYLVNMALYKSIEYLKALHKRKKVAFKDENVYLSEKLLDEGFSFNALKEVVKSINPFFDEDYLISLFLDRSIEEGIVVPVIHHDHKGQILYRAYRHGEDLPFGKADRYRFVYFLSKLDYYLKSFYNTDTPIRIADVTFHKIIVLFFQMGLKQGIFNRFLGFENDQILQQRFCIHGAVLALQKNARDHIYMEKERNKDGQQEDRETLKYVIAILQGLNQENEFLKKQKISGKQGGEYYYIVHKNIQDFLSNSMNSIQIDLIIKREIDKTAKMIASWYWLEDIDRGPGNLKNDLMCMTSCSDIFVFSSCVATALHYFEIYWEEEASDKLINLKSGFKSDDFDQTLPSARIKHKWYLIRKNSKIFEYVRSLFEQRSMLDQLTCWDNTYSKEILDIGSNDLRYLLEKGLVYVYRYSIIYSYLCSEMIYDPDCSSKEFDIKKCILDFINKRDDLDNSTKEEVENIRKFKLLLSNGVIKEMKALFSKLDKIQSISIRVNYLRHIVNGYVNDSKTIVDGLEDQIKGAARNYAKRYGSCMIIDLFGVDEKEGDNYFRKIWDKLPENTYKTMMNIIYLGKEKDVIRYAFFYENMPFENSYKYYCNIFSVLDSIHMDACKCGFETEVVLLPNLPTGLSFLHHTRENIRQEVAKFNEKIGPWLKCINRSKSLDYVHRLTLFSTVTTSSKYVEEVKNRISGLSYLSFSSEKDKNNYGIDCYSFVSGKKITTSKQVYSTLKLFFDGESKAVGMGVLFQYTTGLGNEIYCLSCNHILQDHPNASEIFGYWMGNEHDKIKLKIVSNYIKNRIKAEDDVLILKPEIDRNDFEKNKVFSLQDVEYIDEKCDIKEKYELFSYASVQMGELIEGIDYCGMTGGGFVQIKGTKDKIGEGDSGASYITSDGKRFVGIHAREKEVKGAQHNNDKYAVFYMIPAQTLINGLKFALTERGERV